jgi:hypothetical protein
MIHLVEKSSKLFSASVKWALPFIWEKKIKKKYFTLNKWRWRGVAQVTCAGRRGLLY